MSAKPQPLAIEVHACGGVSTELIKTIRRATGQPLSLIQRQLNDRAAVYSVVLVPEQFFAGTKQLLAFITALDELGVEYEITANGAVIDKAALDQIASNVEHVRPQDLR